MPVLISSAEKRNAALQEYKSAADVPRDTLVDIAATPEFSKLLIKSGFTIPVYIQFEAFAKCVTAAGEELPKGQTVKQRLWDLLAACQSAIQQGKKEFTYRTITAKNRREPIRLKCQQGKAADQNCYLISFATSPKQ